VAFAADSRCVSSPRLPYGGPSLRERRAYPRVPVALRSLADESLSFCACVQRVACIDARTGVLPRRRGLSHLSRLLRRDVHLRDGGRREAAHGVLLVLRKLRVSKGPPQAHSVRVCGIAMHRELSGRREVSDLHRRKYRSRRMAPSRGARPTRSGGPRFARPQMTPRTRPGHDPRRQLRPRPSTASNVPLGDAPDGRTERSPRT
jgi:hypothetical protein